MREWIARFWYKYFVLTSFDRKAITLPIKPSERAAVERAQEYGREEIERRRWANKGD
jgi:hypothetical protein